MKPAYGWHPHPVDLNLLAVQWRKVVNVVRPAGEHLKEFGDLEQILHIGELFRRQPRGRGLLLERAALGTSSIFLFWVEVVVLAHALAMALGKFHVCRTLEAVALAHALAVALGKFYVCRAPDAHVLAAALAVAL